MTISMFFSSLDQPYLVHFDPIVKVWRILDSMKLDKTNLDDSTEIPDTHPAVTLLTEGAFIELIKEASKIGKLALNSDNSDVFSNEGPNDLGKLEALSQELKELMALLL